MNHQKIFSRRSFVIANLALLTALGSLKPVNAADESAPAPAEVTTPCTRLFELIDAAKYSQEDKEKLKVGLSVGIPGMTNESFRRHVSQETIDTQIKKSQGDYNSTLAMISAVAQQFEEKSTEFLKSENFQRIPAEDREVVVTYFKEVTEHYRAAALAALFNQYGRTVTIPPTVTPSVTNENYRALVSLAAKTPPQKHRGLAAGETAYELKHGDSLAGVARKHNVSPEAILKANPGLIPTRMQPGQVLVIPLPPAPKFSSTVPPLNKEAALSSTR